MNMTTLTALQARFSDAYREQVEASPWKRTEMVGQATTRADIDLEAAMSAAARQVLGLDLVVIGEEAVSAGAWADIHAETAILIDPIDGTRLFRAKDPGFASTFALLERGRFVGGAISLPAAGRELLFSAADSHFTSSDHPAGAHKLELAVRTADTPEAAHLADHFSRCGFAVCRLGSSARRLLDIAEGRCGGLIKRVDSSFGVPRLWGVATGLAYCSARGAQFWWHQGSQTMAVGGSNLQSCWPDRSELEPISYMDLWTTLTAIGGN